MLESVVAIDAFAPLYSLFIVVVLLINLSFEHKLPAAAAAATAAAAAAVAAAAVAAAAAAAATAAAAAEAVEGGREEQTQKHLLFELHKH